jgi:hypothetical protein
MRNLAGFVGSLLVVAGCFVLFFGGAGQALSLVLVGVALVYLGRARRR